MEYVTLNNGVRMPQVGFGTYLIPDELFEKTIINAYELGYRQFDTAWRYHNERNLMNTLRKHGVKREDVFITTKINADALYKGGYQYGFRGLFVPRNMSIDEAIEDSFNNLQLEYIDLFLVHFPWPMFKKMWKALEKYYKQGRIRAIGVSSFLPPHIEALRDISDVVPAVNQFEISPLNTQKDIIEYCNKNSIAVEAMSTFSHFHSNEPRMEIINNSQIIKIAEAHNKSTVQVVLRWMLQQGIIVIPKTWNEQYQKDNISIFDFVLTQEEMSEIDSLDQGRCLNYNPYLCTRGVPRKYVKWSGFNDPVKVPEYYLNRPKWKKIFF